VYLEQYAHEVTTDAEKVSKFSTAAARGLTFTGIAPSPKHFPGHGDTHVDSHIGLPRIEKTKQQLDTTELVPFKQLVSDGVATVMTGHMALPIVVGDDTPCSLSRTITTDLLRTEMGFEGVIVTDCLEMDAVANAYGTEQGAVKSLQAGADVAMICHRIERQKGAIEATYEAVQSGAISLEELKASGKRIRTLKEEFAGSWDDVLKTDLDMERLQELKRASALASREAYARSIAVLSDEKRILPLKVASTGSIFVFTPEMETLNRAVDDAENVIRTADGKLRNTAGPSYIAFAASVSQRARTQVVHVVYGAGDGPPADINNATAIIYATRSADRSKWQLEYLLSLLKVAGQTRIVVLATLTPYEMLTPVAGRDAAYLCSFEFTPAALDSAAAVVFGEVQAKGKLPVRRGV
jgi:beta-N-acetylhexosaminidase